ncbi:Aspartic proteinase nepenthesin-1 [Vitis vinifera]|uniref:Aspartic proteinase nepenthesin-1 n=1 Tax=Vitis vinifera TaxID=29760 RepID=A0A438C3C6_VITVI|nr:Aspartic proteinase nepenthesin-1 [Vitis vinifera]
MLHVGLPPLTPLHASTPRQLGHSSSLSQSSSSASPLPYSSTVNAANVTSRVSDCYNGFSLPLPYLHKPPSPSLTLPPFISLPTIAPMAPPPYPLPSLPFLLLILTVLGLPRSSSTLMPGFRRQQLETGFQVGLRHIDAGRNFTKLQLIQRGINRGRQRLQRMSGMATTAERNDFQAPVHVGDGEFVVNLMIGTPPVPFPAIMDTGSDLIWTQCNPCKLCFQQSTPVFNPKRSSTFSNISCSSKLCKGVKPSKCDKSCEYRYTYGDESSTEGFMAMDTITFGESPKRVSIPRIGFGCGLNNRATGMDQTAGLLGLGRGVLSLVSQLGTQKFSYCLTSIHENKTSSLLFGSLAYSNFNPGKIPRTPLIQNPLLPSYYYLSLKGITVGYTLLPIPEFVFQLGKDGSGGMILDSGTTITYLQEDAFDVLKNAFISQTELQVANSSTTGLDLCFHLPVKNAAEVKVPKLIFHFKGLDLALPVENYMVSDPEMGLICLAIDATGSLSILGTFSSRTCWSSMILRSRLYP